MKQVSVSVDDALFEFLKKESVGRRRSLSGIVREMLWDLVDWERKNGRQSAGIESRSDSNESGDESMSFQIEEE